MTILERVVAYIEDNLGEMVEIGPWLEEGALPLYLREPYQYQMCRIHGRDILLMIVRSTDAPSPAVIAKQSGAVRDRAGLEPVVVFASLSAYNRKRLVERGVSFIVPGNQMYLAPLGIDFREHHRVAHVDVQTVQPATQCTIIALLTRRLPEAEYTPSDIAKTLGYSAMTLTRVFRELEAISFGEREVSGRTRLLRIRNTDHRELWKGALPHLTTPVKRVETVQFHGTRPAALPIAGITALARHSDLAEPRRTTLAIDASLWRTLLADKSVENVPSTEETATSVEIWKYPPHMWSSTVDPLSLYLSLRTSPDERVQSALKYLLEHFPW